MSASRLVFHAQKFCDLNVIKSPNVVESAMQSRPRASLVSFHTWLVLFLSSYRLHKWGLSDDLASNFGAPGQPRQQLRRSRSTFASNQQLRCSRSTSPATSKLPVNLRQQLQSSRATFASNFGAPEQPRQQLRRSRSTSPATSALPSG